MNEQTQTQTKNRNGRNGILTAWDINAVNHFKSLYNLYSQFKDKIYLEDSDKVLLLNCYKGKTKFNCNDDKSRILKRFLQRQFILMGYPKSEFYIKMINGLMVLDFGLNEAQINKTLFNEYMTDNRLTEENEAHKNDIGKEKAKGNIKPFAEKVNNEATEKFNIYYLKGGSS